MFSISLSFVVVFLLPFFGSCFQIDHYSCDEKQRDWLTEQFECTFNMAQDAVDILSGNDESKQKAANDAIGYLFGEEIDEKSRPAEWVLFRFAGGETREGAEIRTRARGVLSMRNFVPAGHHLSSDDVKIFCDLSRFEWVEGQNQYRDTIGGDYLEEGEPDPRKACDETTLAYTHRPAGEKANQITVCPVFLSYARKEKWLKCKGTLSKMKWAAGSAAAPFIKLRYSEVDIWGLSERVFLHELTHTEAAGRAVDIRVNNEAGFGRSNTAYGWKRCRKIAKKPKGHEQGSNWNADSFALFGTVARLIKAGKRVNSKGKVKKLQDLPTSTSSSLGETETQASQGSG